MSYPTVTAAALTAPLTFAGIVEQLRDTFRAFPDCRKPGNNTRYTLEDAGLSAFSVFFMQCASFLEYQRRMVENQERSNAQTLFGVHAIPCDNQIRHLLDSVPPSAVAPAYRYLFNGLQQNGYLAKWRVHDYGYLLALDGTQHFSSSHIHCEQCLTKTHHNGTVTYSHQVLTPILTAPDKPQVIPLPPEFISRQDGQTKQDCEINAAKRWLAQWGADYIPLGITFLGDDLYCHQPFCQAVLDAGAQFIFNCKPTSHTTLYEELEGLEKIGAIRTHLVQRRMGKHSVTDTYRFATQMPLRDGDDALRVNWFSLTSVRDDGKCLYHNDFATSHPITTGKVVDLVKAGRCRWKIENENNNTLKTKGYHFEHNFGHGQQHLANLLAALVLLAYLVHTVIDLMDERFRTLLQKMGSRERLFDDINTLTTFLCFKSWTALLDFMLVGLERRHQADEIEQWVVK